MADAAALNESFSKSMEESYEDRIYDSVFYCLSDN